MAVIIKDMEMPKNCLGCHFLNAESTKFFCNRIMKYIDKHEIIINRHKDCPLVEIITCENCNNHGMDKQHHPDIDGARYCPTLHTYTGYEYYCGDAEHRTI